MCATTSEQHDFAGYAGLQTHSGGDGQVTFVGRRPVHQGKKDIILCAGFHWNVRSLLRLRRSMEMSEFTSCDNFNIYETSGLANPGSGISHSTAAKT